MRRYLILFLLVLMPLQFSWAAAGAYCGHEAGEKAQHFGHHPHQHASGDKSSDVGTGKVEKQKGSHPDCSACHAGVVALIDGPPVPDCVDWSSAEFTRSDPISSSLNSPPERPQWAYLA